MLEAKNACHQRMKLAPSVRKQREAIRVVRCRSPRFYLCLHLMIDYPCVPLHFPLR